MLKKLYDWVIHWAETKYGVPVMAFVSFIESSVFPIPPDPLLMALGLSKPNKAILYAIICSVASIAGGLVGYLIGWTIWEIVQGPAYYVAGLLTNPIEYSVSRERALQ